MEPSPSWEANSHSASQEILPTFYVTRKFITVFTRTQHTGPHPEPDESNPQLPTLPT
jgi:hypothetical protein